MKNLSKAGLEMFRVKQGTNASFHGDQFGMFILRMKNQNRPTWLVCVVADDYPRNGEDPGTEWEHVSVTAHYEKKSGKKRRVVPRTPTWEEMDLVKRLFWEPDEVCFQLHVAEKDHLNCHPHCLHLWRRPGEDPPLPPAEYVAPQPDAKEESKEEAG